VAEKLSDVEDEEDDFGLKVRQNNRLGVHSGDLRGSLSQISSPSLSS
jgi:hypothetical protein